MMPPLISLAQEHRVGIGAGMTAGKFTLGNTDITLEGEVVEMPLYIYSSDIGISIGFRISEFTTRGSDNVGSSSDTLNISNGQSLLVGHLGYELSLGDYFVIGIRYLKSYMGNSRTHYSYSSTYFANTIYSYEYITTTDIVKGKAELAGLEIPIYFKTDKFYYGLRYSAIASGTTETTADGSEAIIKLNATYQFCIEAIF